MSTQADEARKAPMNTSTNLSTHIQSQLLVTKFYVPIAPGTLIARPRLTSLLHESLKYPLTLVLAGLNFNSNKNNSMCMTHSSISVYSLARGVKKFT